MSEQSINSLNIPSIQNNKPIHFQQNPVPAMQGSTAMQGVPKNVGDTELGNRVKNSSDMATSPYTLPVGLGTWYIIAQGMDKFSKKCNGTYDESILGKITGKADKLSNKVTESRLFKSSFGQWVGKQYNAIKSYVDKISSNPKNRIFYALRNHKTNPECKLVKVPAAGLDGFLEADTRQVFEEFLKPAKNGIQLQQYGKDKAYIDNFMNSVKGLSKHEKRLKLQDEELKYFKEIPQQLEATFNKLGKKDKIRLITSKMTELGDEVNRQTLRSYLESSDSALLNKFKELRLKELKITKGLGFDSIAHYRKLTNEDYALTHMDEILKALRKGDQNLKVMIWKKDGAIGKAISHLFGREVGISELANKFDLSLKTGAKTKFGKFVGKAFGYLTEGCTNRFAGGKLAVAMQAFIFADMLIHTFNAPKGEKGKTLAERFVNDFTYFLALPLGIWAMHKAGGLKYLGMTADQVKAYRENLKLFNKNHKLYGKNMHKMRKKALNRQLMAGVKNPFIKLLKKAANLLTIGIERTKPYISKDKFNLNFLRKSKYWGKNALGYGIRFAIPMMLISPLIAKWTTKGAHKIFGRPTQSVLDEDKEETTTPAATTPVTTNPQQNQTKPVQPAPGTTTTTTTQTTIKSIPNSNPQNFADSNLIKQRLNGQNPAQTTKTVTTTTTTTTTSQTQTAKDQNKEQEPVRTYIPSPIGMVPPSSANLTAADQALAHADMAEQSINETLKSIKY